MTQDLLMWGSDHYIGFVKKSVFHATKSPAPAAADAAGPSMPGGMTISAPSGGAAVGIDEDDANEDWYKFNDDKVSVFPKEKLGTLNGGGEDSSAYVLVYKSKPLV